MYPGGVYVRGSSVANSAEFCRFSALLLAFIASSVLVAALTREDRATVTAALIAAACAVSAAVLFPLRRLREPVRFFPIVLMLAVFALLIATTRSDIVRVMNVGYLSGVGTLAAWYFGTSVFRRLYLVLFTVGVGVAVLCASITATNRAEVTWAALSLSALAMIAVSAIARLRTFEERQSLRDALTNSLNRRGLERFLADAALERRRRNDTGVVLLLDLDAFKVVNDTLGHAEGDRILRGFAAAWKSVLRSGDCIARLGGDEFAVILRGAAPGDIDAVIERVAEVSPIAFSVGAAPFTAHADFSEVLERADVQLYEHKRRRNG